MPACKILVVEDDAEDRGIVADAMKELDAVDVLCFAEHGEKAFDMLRQGYAAGNTPCLIVLDLNLPKLSGSQILSLLKHDVKFRQVPVIIFSTSVNPIEKAKCMELGAETYITKPVTFAEAKEIAAMFLRYCK